MGVGWSRLPSMQRHEEYLPPMKATVFIADTQGAGTDSVPSWILQISSHQDSSARTGAARS